MFVSEPDATCEPVAPCEQFVVLLTKLKMLDPIWLCGSLQVCISASITSVPLFAAAAVCSSCSCG